MALTDCDLNNYFLIDCEKGLGGIAEFYALEQGSISGITEVSGVVTAITTVGSKKYNRYQLRDEVGSLASTPTANEQNGSLYYEQMLTFALDQLVTPKRNELMRMVRTNVNFIVKDENGRYWMGGKTKGMYITGGEGGTGTAKGDLSGFNRVFTAKEKEDIVEVALGLITSDLINGL